MHLHPFRHAPARPKYQKACVEVVRAPSIHGCVSAQMLPFDAWTEALLYCSKNALRPAVPRLSHCRQRRRGARRAITVAVATAATAAAATAAVVVAISCELEPQQLVHVAQHEHVRVKVH
eukprot:6182979-Pleurochrysis_carterae.AAC.5